MRALPIFKSILAVIFTLLFVQTGFSQEGTVEIEQSKKLDLALKERKRLLKKEEIRTHFTVQVFAGDLEPAQKILKESKTQFTDFKSQIHFETPYYKVWIGNYRNRLDADRALLEIVEEYPDAIVIKPRNKSSK